MNLPDFVIFGGQKAGSTFLLEALRAHPQIFMPREEIAFFEGNLYEPDQLNRFAQNFQHAQPGQRIGFKRPNLLGHAESAERMKNDLGEELRLIAILRNPIERAISAYFHSAATGIIKPRPVEEGLDMILQGKFEHPRAEEILTFGLYGRHLLHFEKFFPRNQFCVILLDDIKTEMSGVLESVCEFLGISGEIPMPDRSRRPMAAPYSMNRIRIKRALESVAKTWDQEGNYFSFKSGPYWQYYMKAVRGFDQLLMRRIFSGSCPRLSALMTSRLQQYYHDDLSILGTWLGRDLTHWSITKENNQ